MKKLFLIIGAPGSGKTTDASIIAKNDSKFSHYSTGDLLRAEVASGSDLGRLIDSFISKGNLVPLDVVVNTIVSTIKSSKVCMEHCNSCDSVYFNRWLSTNCRANVRA